MPDEFEKKTERLDVRLSNQKKQAFSEACENQGDTPSGAVRRFIISYIRRAGRDDVKAALRSPPMKKRFVFGGAAAALLIAGAAVFLFKGDLESKMNLDELFAYYDADSSGVLELMEVSVNDHHLHRVLNMDGEAGISRDEFITHATMMWKFTVPEDLIVLQTEKTVMGRTHDVRVTMPKLPEGSYIPTGDPENPFVTPEEYMKLGLHMKRVRQNLDIDPQDLRKFEKDTPIENPNSFVIFDIRNPSSIRLDVLEHKSSGAFSKSMVYSRSVEWVRDSDTPHYVMGRGSEEWKAMMAAKTPKL